MIMKYLFPACLHGLVPVYDYNFVSQTQSIKAREQQSSLQQQQQHPHSQQSPQQIQMQQLMLQRQQQEQQQQEQHQQQQQHPQQQQQRRQQKQQQRNESSYLPTSPQNGSVSADPPTQLNTVATSSLSAKAYEERMKISAQRDTLDEASVKVIPKWQYVLLLKYPLKYF